MYLYFIFGILLNFLSLRIRQMHKLHQLLHRYLPLLQLIYSFDAIKDLLPGTSQGREMYNEVHPLTRPASGRESAWERVEVVITLQDEGAACKPFFSRRIPHGQLLVSA